MDMQPMAAHCKQLPNWLPMGIVILRQCTDAELGSDYVQPLPHRQSLLKSDPVKKMFPSIAILACPAMGCQFTE
jgi:hypothetical protein